MVIDTERLNNEINKMEKTYLFMRKYGTE